MTMRSVPPGGPRCSRTSTLLGPPARAGTPPRSPRSRPPRRRRRTGPPPSPGGGRDPPLDGGLGRGPGGRRRSRAPGGGGGGAAPPPGPGPRRRPSAPARDRDLRHGPRQPSPSRRDRSPACLEGKAPPPPPPPQAGERPRRAGRTLPAGPRAGRGGLRPPGESGRRPAPQARPAAGAGREDRRLRRQGSSSSPRAPTTRFGTGPFASPSPPTPARRADGAGGFPVPGSRRPAE